MKITCRPMTLSSWTPVPKVIKILHSYLKMSKVTFCSLSKKNFINPPDMFWRRVLKIARKKKKNSPKKSNPPVSKILFWFFFALPNWRQVKSLAVNFSLSLQSFFWSLSRFLFFLHLDLTLRKQRKNPSLSHKAIFCCVNHWGYSCKSPVPMSKNV